MPIIKRQLLVNYEYGSQLNLIIRENNIIVASSFIFFIIVRGDPIISSPIYSMDEIRSKLELRVFPGRSLCNSSVFIYQLTL